MRREKSLRNGVHDANAAVWGPVQYSNAPEKILRVEFDRARRRRRVRRRRDLGDRRADARPQHRAVVIVAVAGEVAVEKTDAVVAVAQRVDGVRGESRVAGDSSPTQYSLRRRRDAVAERVLERALGRDAGDVDAEEGFRARRGRGVDVFGRREERLDLWAGKREKRTRRRGDASSAPLLRERRRLGWELLERTIGGRVAIAPPTTLSR